MNLPVLSRPWARMSLTLRRAHLRRAGESRRFHHYSRSFEQRWLGGDSTCKLCRCHPDRLTRTSEKTGRLHEAGAAHVTATQEQDIVAEVMRITSSNGARVAFDPVGGPAFPKLISALAD